MLGGLLLDRRLLRRGRPPFDRLRQIQDIETRDGEPVGHGGPSDAGIDGERRPPSGPQDFRGRVRECPVMEDPPLSFCQELSLFCGRSVSVPPLAGDAEKRHRSPPRGRTPNSRLRSPAGGGSRAAKAKTSRRGQRRRRSWTGSEHLVKQLVVVDQLVIALAEALHHEGRGLLAIEARRRKIQEDISLPETSSP